MYLVLRASSISTIHVHLLVSMHENILRSILRMCRYQLLAKKRMRRTGHVLQTWQLQTDVEFWTIFARMCIDFCCRIDMVAAWNR